MAYGCLVWVGGPRAGVVVRVVAQPTCLAGCVPGIYLVYQYTWYVHNLAILTRTKLSIPHLSTDQNMEHKM